MYIAIPSNSLNREQFEYMNNAPEYFYLFLEYRGGVHPGQVCRRANTDRHNHSLSHSDLGLWTVERSPDIQREHTWGEQANSTQTHRKAWPKVALNPGPSCCEATVLPTHYCHCCIKRQGKSQSSDMLTILYL